MSQIYCSNCGKMIPETSKFCRFCGAAQHGPEAGIYRVEQPTLGKTAVKAAEKSRKNPLKDTEEKGAVEYIKRRSLCPQVKISFIIGYLQKTSIIPLLLLIGLVFDPIVFGGAILFYALALYVSAALAYNYFFYSIDETGFQKEYGIIHKHSVSVPYSNIQNVNISRSLIDRLLGLARINIETAGSASIDDRDVIGGSSSKAEAHLPGVTLEQAKKIHDLVVRNIDN